MNLTEHIPHFTPPAPTTKMAGSNFGFSGKKFKPKKKTTWSAIHCAEREELLPVTFNKVNGIEMY